MYLLGCLLICMLLYFVVLELNLDLLSNTAHIKTTLFAEVHDNLAGAAEIMPTLKDVVNLPFRLNGKPVSLTSLR